MKIEEQAAFYKTLVRRGISIFPNPTASEVLAAVVHKVFTSLDDRVYLDGSNKAKAFATDDDAIEFVKRFIGWTFETSVQTENKEPEVTNCYFEAHMMIDIGFGPQNVPLGQLVSTCQNDDWRKEVQNAANELARKYLVKNYPERDPDGIAKSVKVRPASS